MNSLSQRLHAQMDRETMDEEFSPDFRMEIEFNGEMQSFPAMRYDSMCVARFPRFLLATIPIFVVCHIKSQSTAAKFTNNRVASNYAKWIVEEFPNIDEILDRGIRGASTVEDKEYIKYMCDRAEDHEAYVFVKSSKAIFYDVR